MKRTPLKRKTPLRIVGHSDTAQIKQEIQDTVRQIVMKRDRGCIFSRGNPEYDPQTNGYRVPPCNGYNKFHQLIFQADHLITRANSATYADPRLIVCVCKGHHAWKKWNEQRYNEIVRGLIGIERAALWEKMHNERYIPHRKTAYDWKLELAALKQELKKMS